VAGFCLFYQPYRFAKQWAIAHHKVLHEQSAGAALAQAHAAGLGVIVKEALANAKQGITEEELEAELVKRIEAV